MTEKELRQLIVSKKEGEGVEFKTASNDFSVLGGVKQDKRSLYGYAVGMGNNDGGHIIFGITDDRKVVGTQAFKDIEKVQSQLYERMGIRVGIHEFFLPERVVVVDIPKRRTGKLFEFYGRYLTRAGEGLVEMKQDEIAAILGETQDDFSAKYLDVGIEVLDAGALRKVRRLFEEKAKKLGQDTKSRLSDAQFLSDLGLMKAGKINNAALLLAGTDESLRDLLQDAEIIFEYRVNPHDTKYSDRLNLRRALVFSLELLWDKINSRNFVSQLRERLIRRDIPAFNEEVVREALNNAVAHRDYQVHKSIVIKQDNTKVTIENPGGFLPGITPQNIYKQVSYRNRRLAESLEKIGYVERSGQGADLIFENTIREGKGIPQYESTAYDVSLTVSAIVKDQEIIVYLDEVIDNKGMALTVDDLVLLEKIKERNAKGVLKKDVQKFIDAGVVVADGVGRGTKFFLSKQYYKDHDRLGEYTKIRGLSRAGIKELIIKHLRENGKIRSQECRQISPNLGPKDVTNILQELRKDGKIAFVGSQRSKKGYWVLVGTS